MCQFVSLSCQFRQKRVMFKWNSAISVFISNSKKRLSCLMRIQLLCFHARYNLNIVMVSEIQPIPFHVKSNHNIVMLVEIQPFPFSQVRSHVKLTSNLHHVMKFQPFSLPCQIGLIQTLHILEFALLCKIFIDHSPRRSSKETILVDNLSRSDTTSENDLTLIASATKKGSGWPTSYMVCKPKFLYRFFAHLYR